MNCLSCYKDNTVGFCGKCSRKLSGSSHLSHMLPFDTPQDGNIKDFQEQTKRLSISGAQLKYSLRNEGDLLVLSENNGQYILKPMPPSIIAYPAEAPENERLTMQIASQVFRISTAANGVVYFADGQPAYLTRRFDIKPDGSKYLQEDFAQLSGKSKKINGENYKYSGTYEDMGLLIRKYVAAYMPALEIFFKTVLFNYLFSNGDAHLKNFSLIEAEGGGYTLSPAYDLMCTVIHMPGETDTALDLFEGDIDTAYYQTYGHHGYPDFMELAMRLSLIKSRAERIIAEMTNKTDKVTGLINRSILVDEVKAKYLSCYVDKLTRITTSSTYV